ncbi:hypothetical protein [Streptomyces echinatus]|uniref:Integral membrane protein n=1 Tax=Streptomyces echinatus TaxID=67293 RepID=A0A7W9PQS2_9ACTN|nr:hypothetical protein [Streptomyces echinatus]MBB5925929.1 hypothetical protein [Streptomyces echinatus]
MERARLRRAGRYEERVTGRPTEPGADLELLVHGVGGTTPEKMLGDPRTVRVTGDDTAAVFRRAEDAGPAPDAGAESGSARDPGSDPGRTEPGRDRGEEPGGDLGRPPVADLGKERGRGPVREAYVWCNLTSGDGSRALWLLLLPFMVVNLAHWMRPAGPGRPRTVRLYGLLVRLLALTLTVLLAAAACEVALDLVAWQCAGSRACVRRHSWLGFLSPAAPGAPAGSGGWWSAPGRRLALAAVLPAALTGLLWYLSHRTWNAYESQRPLSAATGTDTEDPGAVAGAEGPQPDNDDPGAGARGPGSPACDPESCARGPGPGGDAPGAGGGGAGPGSHRCGAGAGGPGAGPRHPVPGGDEAESGAHGSALIRPGFWYGRRLVARLRAAHTAAGLLTVAAAVATPAARFDHRPGGPAALEALGRPLVAALFVWAVAVVGVVCRRGRSENRLDRRLDRRLVRSLPLVALVLLLLSVVYAGWSRPGWRSTGRLPGDPAFGALMLVQGLLVVALGAVARDLYRRRPDPRAGMRGLGGPAVTLLACALGGVMSGGIAQRVADWLDGTRALLAGPPVLLTWQASAIPPTFAVLSVLAVLLALRTARLARAERDRVRHEHPGEPEDPSRTRAIAHARAMAALTDRVPLVVTVLTVTTLLLGTGALIGALATGKTPDGAAHRTHHVVRAVAETSQALGSWLVGLGFLLFVTWGRRAYKDASARRTIGILWDVGTFWPRAAHPFAPPCYAERAVPDLTWRMATWTRRTGGRLVLSGHSQGSVLAAAAAWQLPPSVRGRVALLTYGSPLERLYGRWFPAHFGPPALAALHHDIACWRNLYRRTDPIGGPVRVPGDATPEVDHEPLPDPRAYGRTADHPLPAPILGHSDYQSDPAFTRERALLLARLCPGLPGQRPEQGT